MALAFDANLGTVTNSGTLDTTAAGAAGSRIFAFVWWFGTQTATDASSWGGGLDWVVDKQFRGSGGGDQNVCIGTADCPGGWTLGTDIVPTFSATPSFGPGIAAASFTGVETGASGYLDGTPPAGVDDFNEVWATGSIVTTNADDLLIGFSVGGSGTSNTAATNYTEIHDWVAEGTQRCATVYRIVASASTYTPGGTWSTTVDFQTNVGAAYKASGGAPPPDAPTLRTITSPVRWR